LDRSGLEQAAKLIWGQFTASEDTRQQTGADDFAAVDRDDSLAAIGVS